MVREFLYMVFNMLIIPGLAVPAGYNAYKMVTEQLAQLDMLLLNFYIIQTSNFYVTLMIQQTALGFMAMMLQLPQLPFWAFSPSYFLAFRKKTDFKYDYFTKIGDTFDYGYHLSVILAVICIVFIYSFV